MNVTSLAILRQYALVFIANFSILACGMTAAWPSPMLVKLNDKDLTPLSRPITTEEGSWIVSLGYLISVFGNPIAGIGMDIIGRKYSIILISSMKIVACFILLFSKEVWMVILGQVLVLVPNCALYAVVPVYASEIASKEQRGALGTILQIISAVGMVITLSFGPFISYFALNLTILVVLTICTAPILFLPDTPYFHYSKGRINKAIDILITLRGSEIKANEELEEYAKTKNDVKIDKVSVFKNKQFLKRLALGLLICGGSQLIGFNAVSFYLQTILESTHTNIRPEIASVIIGMIQVVSSCCTALTTDKFGRRQILISSLVGMFLGMLCLGIFFKLTLGSDQIVGFMNYLPILSLILIVFCYSGGLGSLVWTLTAEFFDGPTRAFGVALSLASSPLGIFITSKYFAPMTIALGPAITYWVFGGCCAVMCLLVAIFIPETKGKTISEIQVALDGKRDEKTNDVK